jgi:hypothetical protein
MAITPSSCRHTHQRLAPRFMVAVAIITAFSAMPAEAAKPRRRGPSPQQIQKMKAEIEYRQREVLRVQAEIAAKERELFQRFDENGDGRLLGAEQSKYDKHLYEIRSGKAPNPLAGIVPLGQGPRGSQSGGKK